MGHLEEKPCLIHEETRYLNALITTTLMTAGSADIWFKKRGLHPWSFIWLDTVLGHTPRVTLPRVYRVLDALQVSGGLEPCAGLRKYFWSAVGTIHSRYMSCSDFGCIKTWGYRIIFGVVWKLRSFSIRNFLHPALSSFHIRRSILQNTLFSNILNLSSTHRFQRLNFMTITSNR